MIIYEATKKDFICAVLDNSITHRIYDVFRERVGRTRFNEISSWTDSMAEMGKVIDSNLIPEDASIAIEFNIPLTSNRIDFIITGFSKSRQGRAIIIELKRWQKAFRVEGKDGIVKTALGGGIHETTHPSYQAWSYSHLLNDYNETIREEGVSILPCAFLHNMERKDSLDLLHSQYKKYLDISPVYLKDDYALLRKFIEATIEDGDQKIVLFKLDDGRIKPSKSLQDVLIKMLRKNDEFTLIDSQKVVYEQAINLAGLSKKDGRKRVLIVEGGPGTGKTVIAINLLVELNQIKGSAVYVSKNAAPRNVYAKKLKGEYKQDYISKLFQGSGVFCDSPRDIFDSIIVDEAHRLNEKSGMYRNRGENQIKEIINAGKFSIFFIDEDQRIDINDIGTKDEIIKWANQSSAKIDYGVLDSQFRCNGSDGYLAWLDHLLGVRETANFDGFNMRYDFKVFDDPNKLLDTIKEKNLEKNRARVVAGYCWEWVGTGRNMSSVFDINLDQYNFHKSWNLNSTPTWAIDPTSIDEIGCVHTSQGLEFDYVGVIIGPDFIVRNGTIITDATKRAKTDRSLRGIKSIMKSHPEKAKEIADKIIKNTYRTLMTRGMKGCYVFSEDNETREYFNSKVYQLGRKHKLYGDINDGLSI
jgi:DUF2075 family protein